MWTLNILGRRANHGSSVRFRWIFYRIQWEKMGFPVFVFLGPHFDDTRQRAKQTFAVLLFCQSIFNVCLCECTVANQFFLPYAWQIIVGVLTFAYIINVCNVAERWFRPREQASKQTSRKKKTTRLKCFPLRRINDGTKEVFNISCCMLAVPEPVGIKCYFNMYVYA